MGHIPLDWKALMSKKQRKIVELFEALESAPAQVVTVKQAMAIMECSQQTVYNYCGDYPDIFYIKTSKITLMPGAENPFPEIKRPSDHSFITAGPISQSLPTTATQQLDRIEAMLIDLKKSAEST